MWFPKDIWVGPEGDIMAFFFSKERSIVLYKLEEINGFRY